MLMRNGAKRQRPRVSGGSAYHAQLAVPSFGETRTFPRAEVARPFRIDVDDPVTCFDGYVRVKSRPANTSSPRDLLPLPHSVTSMTAREARENFASGPESRAALSQYEGIKNVLHSKN